MPISWNEIRHNAISFARDWAGARARPPKNRLSGTSFSGVRHPRRTVANFEEQVKICRQLRPHRPVLAGDAAGRAQELRRDLGKAESQAFRYIRDLVARRPRGRGAALRDRVRLRPHRAVRSGAGRPGQLPCSRSAYRPSSFRWQTCIATSTSLPSFRATNSTTLKTKTPSTSKPCGSWTIFTIPWRPAATTATNSNASWCACCFASLREDTGIFERESFRLYIENRTKPDGSDLGPAPGPALRRAEHAAGGAAAEPRRNAGRIPLRQRRAFCREPGLRRLQPRHAQQPAWPARASTGRESRRPFSARSFRPSWSRKSAGKSAATTPANATSSR